MFTAVRFGKTTVDELATNISKVTPIASALGVGFDEVGASLAVLTASGVPTAEAATQMKGAMAELGKAGSVADKAFKAVNRGGSFTDFIADGGSLVEALVKMKVGGEITDKSVIDMFGSIEAGSAVLSLTKNGGLAMVEVMDEMNDSAGATDKAFDVMSETTGFKINQLKATFKVLAIQIGTKLQRHAPHHGCCCCCCGAGCYRTRCVRTFHDCCRCTRHSGGGWCGCARCRCHVCVEQL